tara:strand:+ start:3717 stop:4577 length:861 start_codon:yes stop_codon:yes gene_type:complete
LKTGVLTSGSLGAHTLNEIITNYYVAFVLTDSNSIEILELCKKNNIPFFKGIPRNSAGYDFIKNIDVDVIISVNYLFLIESDIIQHPKKLIFNIHGSLLPKYRGRTPHVWAIINNELETGITAHIINEDCDAGDIISQIKIPINHHDTGNDILNKYKLKYYRLIEEVLGKLKLGQLELQKQDDLLATYFGRRKPEDGRIDWNWQKERIRNWIRAQAHPYPGAFSYIKNKKIIIDEVKEVNFTYLNDTKNGTILSVSPNIIVKTPNGTLQIIQMRNIYRARIGDKLI